MGEERLGSTPGPDLLQEKDNGGGWPYGKISRRIARPPMVYSVRRLLE